MTARKISNRRSSLKSALQRTEFKEKKADRGNDLKVEWAIKTDTPPPGPTAVVCGRKKNAQIENAAGKVS